MKNKNLRTPFVLFFFTILGALFFSEPLLSQETESPVIKHRFLALDESRFQLHFIDQFAPENNWTIPVVKGCMDMQLLDNDRVLCGVKRGGYVEYDVKEKKLAREFQGDKYAAPSVTALRFSDGRTLLSLARKPLEFFLLDAENKEIGHFTLPGYEKVRCTRATPRETLLFGANGNRVLETTLDGKILREVEVPGSNYNYVCWENSDGNLLTAGGYNCFLAEVDQEGKVVKKWGEKPTVNGLPTHFYGSMQLLKNGNVCLSNWTGHKPDDSKKGVQVLEIDPKGDVVWFWHDPKTAGSINAAIVFE